MSSTYRYRQQPGTSGLAIAGLIFSTLGWFSFGLLALPGVMLSACGLASRGPKGVAIAGLIVGLPPVAVFVLVGWSIVAGFFGIIDSGPTLQDRIADYYAEQPRDEAE